LGFGIADFDEQKTGPSRKKTVDSRSGNWLELSSGGDRYESKFNRNTAGQFEPVNAGSFADGHHINGTLARRWSNQRVRRRKQGLLKSIRRISGANAATGETKKNNLINREAALRKAAFFDAQM